MQAARTMQSASRTYTLSCIEQGHEGRLQIANPFDANSFPWM